MTLTGQLKHMLDCYFHQHPNMSLNALALKSGIGATTLRRIRNQEIKGDPAPHTVLAFVSALTNEKRLSILVDKFDGPLGELLKESFGPYVESSLGHSFQAELSTYLRDATSYFVYKLCANRAGISREEIERNYGLQGLKKLDQMHGDKLIELKNHKGQERYFAVANEYSLDVDTVLGHLPQLAAHFKLGEVSKGRNLFYNMSESLNEEGIQKIKAIQKEAVLKMLDVFKSPFYEGDIPFFTLNMCDTQLMPAKPEYYQ